MKTYLPALVRALLAAGVPLLVLGVLDSRLNPEQGPNIGGGFVILLALFVVPLGWAWVDGRHRGSRPTLVVWALAAALVLVADVVRMLVMAGGFGASDLGYAFFFAAFVMPWSR